MGYSLDDYIYSLEARGGARGPGGGGTDPDADVHAQLLAKERDLILAAELGKALLEKNEDLSKQNEKIAEEFSQKLEVGGCVTNNLAAGLSCKLRAFPTILNRSPLCRTKGGWVFFGEVAPDVTPVVPPPDRSKALVVEPTSLWLWPVLVLST